jgi:hypothetical protein
MVTVFNLVLSTSPFNKLFDLNLILKLDKNLTKTALNLNKLSHLNKNFLISPTRVLNPVVQVIQLTRFYSYRSKQFITRIISN